MIVSKNLLIVMSCVILTISLFGCTSLNDTGAATEPTTNNFTSPTSQRNTFIPNFNQIQHITVFVMPEDPSAEVMITKNEDGTIAELKGFDTLTVVSVRAEIDQVLHMFDGWNMTKVPENEILDSVCQVYIRLGDEVTLGFVEKTNAGYYGTVEGVPCYLPEAFGAYIEELLNA